MGKAKRRKKKPHWSTALKHKKSKSVGGMYRGNRKEWLPKCSTGRGYGSDAQDRRAARLTKQANEDPTRLMTADEMTAYNKAMEQKAIKERFGR